MNQTGNIAIVCFSSFGIVTVFGMEPNVAAVLAWIVFAATDIACNHTNRDYL